MAGDLFISFTQNNANFLVIVLYDSLKTTSIPYSLVKPPSLEAALVTLVALIFPTRQVLASRPPPRCAIGWAATYFALAAHEATIKASVAQ